MTLTKAYLNNMLIELKELDLSHDDAEQIRELFFEEIVSQLERGEEVKLPGLGTFKVRFKKARPGRDPKTREPQKITPRHVVTFSASHILKKQIEKNLKNKAPTGDYLKTSKTNK